uniref:Uncharacterized protein n=1 Tax=Arundo donax TaxID=35708 RepID=A0A0A9GH85_ARUDO
MLMKKKNQLKKRAMRLLSPASLSSNWSDPKPDTLDLSPPVPRAVRYRPRYSTPSCVLLGATQLLLAPVGSAHAGGRSPEAAVEMVRMVMPAAWTAVKMAMVRYRPR